MTVTKSLIKHPVHKRRTVEKGLRELVATLTPGDRLPPLPDLRRHFGVASGTVQAAVEVLSQEGLVIRRHGAGTFVASAGDNAAQRSVTPPAPALTTRALVVFAGYPSAYSRECVEHLIPLAMQQGMDVECRYASNTLTHEDLLRYETPEVEGFVVIGYELAWIAAALIARGHRAAVVGEPNVGADPQVPVAFSDAEQGGYRATKHLLDLGHRRIAYLHTNSPNWLFQRRRWQGHLRALTEAGVATETPRLLDGNAPLNAWYENPDAARQYFTAADAPTAIVAWNDTYAVKLLGALQRAEIRVPEQVSLIGYDNTLNGAHCWPPLDSVDQHTDVLVRHALFLLSLSSPPEMVTAAHLTPTLVCRGSCAAPSPSAIA